MTPNDKGRFCQSCSKTVVDFTKMNKEGIQKYIHNNKDQRICGRINQHQLESINLKIPESIFNQKLSFRRPFLLALLMSMGFTLFNCKNDTGKTKKIETMEILENPSSLNNELITNSPTDSTKKQPSNVVKNNPSKNQAIEGIMIIETIGDIDLSPEENNEEKPLEIGDLEIDNIPHCPGPEADDLVFGFLVVEHKPEFKDTPKELSKEEKTSYFTEKTHAIVKENFNTKVCLNARGIQRIYTQFEIDTNGSVNNIKVRASKPELEAEVRRVLELLPKFIPGKSGDQVVSVEYSLPIIFKVED